MLIVGTRAKNIELAMRQWYILTGDQLSIEYIYFCVDQWPLVWQLHSTCRDVGCWNIRQEHRIVATCATRDNFNKNGVFWS